MPPYNDRGFHQFWHYYRTPFFDSRITRPPSKQLGWALQPQRWQDTALQMDRDPVGAIALDCEMGISTLGEPELIRLTAVDFFKGVVLIDRLVCPNVGMRE